MLHDAFNIPTVFRPLISRKSSSPDTVSIGGRLSHFTKNKWNSKIDWENVWSLTLHGVFWILGSGNSWQSTPFLERHVNFSEMFEQNDLICQGSLSGSPDKLNASLVSCFSFITKSTDSFPSTPTVKRLRKCIQQGQIFCRVILVTIDWHCYFLLT